MHAQVRPFYRYHPISLSERSLHLLDSMPLNSTTYLESHGWEGKGVPLDGKQGRGLKKPLALPMKRNLKGLGKDRDRAVEWWDCLFEVSDYIQTWDTYPMRC